MAEEEKKENKPKQPGKHHRHKNYDNGKTKNKFCPKCGPGFMLAEHSNRRVCGKCGYMESKDKEKEQKEKTDKKEQNKEKTEKNTDKSKESKPKKE